MKKRHLLLVQYIVAVFFCQFFQSALLPGKKSSDLARSYMKAEKAFNRAAEYFEKSELSRAEKYALAALDMCSFHFDSQVILSRLSYMHGNLEIALDWIQKAKSSLKTVRNSFIKIQSRNYERLLDQKQALKHRLQQLERANNRGNCQLSIFDGNIQDIRLQIADIDDRLRNPDQVVPEDISAYIEFIEADLLLKNLNVSEAVLSFWSVIRKNPLLAGESYKGLAEAAFLMRDYEDAYMYLEQAVALGSEPSPAFKRMILDKMGFLQGDSVEAEFPGAVKLFVLPRSDDGATGFLVNTFIVHHPDSLEAVIIDPGAADDRIEAYISEKNLTVVKILNTHGHADHSGANYYYRQLYQVAVAGPQHDEAEYKLAGKENYPQEYLPVDGEFRAGMLMIRTLHLPGHTPGSLALVIDENVFSGDTLFRSGIGRPAGNNQAERSQNEESLRRAIINKLFSLPAHFTVFPGHGLPTSIGLELKAGWLTMAEE